MFGRLLRQLRVLLDRRRFTRDLDEELRFHADMLHEHAASSGTEGTGATDAAARESAKHAAARSSSGVNVRPSRG